MLDMFAKGGLLMWPILLCSVIALAIMIRKALVFNASLRAVSLSPKQAFAVHPELLSPVLEAVEQGEGEKEVTAIGTRTVRDLESGLGTLSLITAICPLLGLTGTVIGMIQAFQVIAAAGDIGKSGDAGLRNMGSAHYNGRRPAGRHPRTCGPSLSGCAPFGDHLQFSGTGSRASDGAWQ